MRVLVDTTIWSAALRRKRPDAVHQRELADLAASDRVVLIGPVRQELLSGIRTSEQFEKLRLRLRSFDDIILRRDDYEQAALFFTECNQRGVQGSATDFLICSVAHRLTCAIYTTDRDFSHYAKHIPVLIHQVAER